MEFIRFSGLKEDHVHDKELSIREIVRAQSICRGQGLNHCNCKTNCEVHGVLASKQGFTVTVHASHKSCMNNEK